MELVDFARSVPNFDSLSHSEKIKHFGWYLHHHKQQDRFDRDAVRRCYEALHAQPPDLSTYLKRLVERRPAALLKDRAGYRLERRVRDALTGKYGQHESTIAVTTILTELAARIPSLVERAFLQEAVSCYHVRAFRAAIVMAWNLAFDHLLEWVLGDADRLAAFNSGIAVRYPKKAGFQVHRRDDFEQMKESEIIEVVGTASLISSGVKKILREKLDKRNTAAHPSNVVVTEAQANDVITDLMNNVVLKLQ